MITIVQCVRKSTARPAKNAVERHKCESSSVDASGGPKIQRFHVRNRWIFLFVG
nr:MAG TPA: hypothetical protein [Caudoviricetes sp.]